MIIGDNEDTVDVSEDLVPELHGDHMIDQFRIGNACCLHDCLEFYLDLIRPNGTWLPLGLFNSTQQALLNELKRRVGDTGKMVQDDFQLMEGIVTSRILRRSRLSLQTWLHGLYWIYDGIQKANVSRKDLMMKSDYHEFNATNRSIQLACATELQDILSLPSYNTAWRMLQLIRKAMGPLPSEPLSLTVSRMDGRRSYLEVLRRNITSSAMLGEGNTLNVLFISVVGGLHKERMSIKQLRAFLIDDSCDNRKVIEFSRAQLPATRWGKDPTVYEIAIEGYIDCKDILNEFHFAGRHLNPNHSFIVNGQVVRTFIDSFSRTHPRHRGIDPFYAQLYLDEFSFRYSVRRIVRTERIFERLALGLVLHDAPPFK